MNMANPVNIDLPGILFLHLFEFYFGLRDELPQLFLRTTHRSSAMMAVPSQVQDHVR